MDQVGPLPTNCIITHLCYSYARKLHCDFERHVFQSMGTPNGICSVSHVHAYSTCVLRASMLPSSQKSYSDGHAQDSENLTFVLQLHQLNKSDFQIVDDHILAS